MSNCDEDQNAAGAASFAEIAASFGILPGSAGTGDLECLNSALADMFKVLRDAALLRPSDQRAAAVRALSALLFFIMRFRTGEMLHAPLIDLMSALLALNNNKVESLVKPAPAEGDSVRVSGAGASRAGRQGRRGKAWPLDDALNGICGSEPCAAPKGVAGALWIRSTMPSAMPSNTAGGSSDQAHPPAQRQDRQTAGDQGLAKRLQ